MEERYRRIEDQKPWLGVALKLQGFAKRRRLKPIVKKRKCLA